MWSETSLKRLLLHSCNVGRMGRIGKRLVAKVTSVLCQVSEISSFRFYKQYMYKPAMVFFAAVLSQVSCHLCAGVGEIL